MAFDKAQWAIDGSHANPNIPRCHKYKTSDTAATVDSSGYFNDVANEVKVGDIIQAYVDTGGTPQVGFFQVSSNSGGVVDVNNIQLVNLGAQDKIYLSTMLFDVGTASAAYVVSPVAGTISKVHTTITGNPGADNIITPSIGGTPVTNGAVTIANGSGAGEVDSATPTAANTVTAGQAIKVETDGGGASTEDVWVVLEITPSVPDSD